MVHSHPGDVKWHATHDVSPLARAGHNANWNATVCPWCVTPGGLGCCTESDPGWWGRPRYWMVQFMKNRNNQYRTVDVVFWLSSLLLLINLTVAVCATLGLDKPDGLGITHYIAVDITLPEDGNFMAGVSASQNPAIDPAASRPMMPDLKGLNAQIPITTPRLGLHWMYVLVMVLWVTFLGLVRRVATKVQRLEPVVQPLRTILWVCFVVVCTAPIWGNMVNWALWQTYQGNAGVLLNYMTPRWAIQFEFNWTNVLVVASLLDVHTVLRSTGHALPQAPGSGPHD